MLRAWLTHGRSKVSVFQANGPTDRITPVFLVRLVQRAG